MYVYNTLSHIREYISFDQNIFTTIIYHRILYDIAYYRDILDIL